MDKYELKLRFPKNPKINYVNKNMRTERNDTTFQCINVMHLTQRKNY
jgi:hypothetical protein